MGQVVLLHHGHGSNATRVAGVEADVAGVADGEAAEVEVQLVLQELRVTAGERAVVAGIVDGEDQLVVHAGGGVVAADVVVRGQCVVQGVTAGDLVEGQSLDAAVAGDGRADVADVTRRGDGGDHQLGQPDGLVGNGPGHGLHVLDVALYVRFGPAVTDRQSTRVEG